MITAEKVRQIADSKLAEGTNYIVDITVKPGNKIIVLLDNDKAITIADCIEMSRHIESGFDREVEDFELSVMSAGLTEPFKITRQYQKNTGRQIDVVTKEGMKLSGKLVSVSDDGIVLETRTKEKKDKNKGKELVVSNININFNQIKQAKRVISF